MIRTFIALEMDADQQQLLESLIRQGRQLLPDLAWVRPEGIHLTLAFLGELSGPQLEQAIMASRAAASQAADFTYRFTSLGTFGPTQQPRVLWMGIAEPSGALNAIQRKLALALEQRGFPVEARPFSPHLTLARIKSPLNAEKLYMLQQLLSHPRSASSEYHVMDLAVMKSELDSSGARYTCLEVCPFKQK